MNLDAPGLYYVVDAGFGNCISDSTDTAPFCQQTDNYIAYMPHFHDSNGSFGSLNGGSTAQEIITGFELADQYALGNINSTSKNTQIYFDSCGYGHSYQENNNDLRLSLPSVPNDRVTNSYSIKNDYTTVPIVYSKECCASWYQPNDNLTPPINEPPHQLDNSYGMFIPSEQAPTYETLFNREVNAVYDAVSGKLLFKLYNASSPALYACTDQDATVAITGTSPSLSINLQHSGTGSLSCASVGLCPLGMTATQSGSQVTCTLSESSFILGLREWLTESAANSVQFLAWAGRGMGDQDNDNKGGGLGGFALTVLTPQEIPDALYAYIGKQEGHRGDGGSSTILTQSALSFYGSDTAEATIDPGNMDVMLIAGGGGGSDRDSTSVGGGGIAIANSSTLSGVSVSVAGETGGGGDTNAGKGGNSDGNGSGGGKSSTSGVGGTGGGGVNWNSSGALIPPTTSPTSWDAGHGSNGNLAGGGGGFGGGAHPGNEDHGAGGGGSWAMANTAYDSTATSVRPDSPNSNNGAVQLS